MTRSFRSVLILGASRGIGAALAREFAAHGARLLLASRDMSALGHLVSDIRASGGDAHARPCDVAVNGDVRDTVAAALTQFGTLDLAIVNAGVGAPERMRDFVAEDLRRVAEVNYFGVANAIEHLLPPMRAQGGGVIAAVTSIADTRGYPGSAAYCSSKAAATRLLESARVDLRREGIRIVTIRPGFVRTDMSAKNEFPMPFMVEPGRAARIIRSRLERGRRVITFPWQHSVLARLSALLPPALFDFFLSRTRRTV
jgi:NAD(P)-dependent dehydrogenase (short-subunit alcohol dehydrogenase family)